MLAGAAARWTGSEALAAVYAAQHQHAPAWPRIRIQPSSPPRRIDEGDPLRLLHLGALTPGPGLDALRTALEAGIEGLELVVADPGLMAGDLRQSVWGLTPVRFEPPSAPGSPLPHPAGAHAVIAPSLGWGALERAREAAAGLGLPLIAGDRSLPAGEARETAEGWRLDASDVSMLARVLATVAEDPGRLGPAPSAEAISPAALATLLSSVAQGRT